MAIPPAISAQEANDFHQHDLLMPGFRFHPTEEELIDFYLRRKVEGKRFNAELIASVDLYRYDPWELPALAAIGEKEWYFYVPRDRKYRNGDRPNRVAASGYWKATGADRTIRTENNRSIGLKKTLVFYCGKAPKGVRTSWIMNEYRLPHSETNRYQKTEISLCRVYKRSGLDDHPQIHQSSKQNSSSDKRPQTSSPQVAPAISPEKAKGTPQRIVDSFPAFPYGSSPSVASMNSATTSTEEDNTSILHHLHTTTHTSMIDELNKLVGLSQSSFVNHTTQFMQANAMSMPLNSINEKIWEWNPLSEVGKDYNIFK